jgi:hypothetical protein
MKSKPSDWMDPQPSMITSASLRKFRPYFVEHRWSEIVEDLQKPSMDCKPYYSSATDDLSYRIYYALSSMIWFPPKYRDAIPCNANHKAHGAKDLVWRCGYGSKQGLRSNLRCVDEYISRVYKVSFKEVPARSSLRRILAENPLKRLFC